MSLHSPKYNFTLSPLKLPKVPNDEAEPNETADAAAKSLRKADPDVLPALSLTSEAVAEQEQPENMGISSVPPVPALPSTPLPRSRKVHQKSALDQKDKDEEEFGVLPTPFTPSIDKTLNIQQSIEVPSLPAGLSASELKKRLDTKKKIKYVFPRYCRLDSNAGIC